MTKEDFERALAEVKPAFGAVTETLEEYRLNGIIPYGAPFAHLLGTGNTLVEQARRHPLSLCMTLSSIITKYLLAVAC